MDKVDMAIARLRQASDMSLLLYEQPLVITISGGNDSSVILYQVNIFEYPDGEDAIRNIYERLIDRLIDRLNGDEKNA